MVKLRLSLFLTGILMLPQLSQSMPIEMVTIPGGSFQMGSSLFDEEKPVHRVHIAAFKMGKYEVTQAQYKAVMGSDPSEFKGDQRPVERVNRFEAKQFITQLNRQSGKHYRLPTEAEWEYAARAGSRSRWSWGDDEAEADQYAWYGWNSNDETLPVGGKRPNAFGLYDMHGNVWEWVADCWNNNYLNAPDNGSAWMTGECNVRIVRGGGWLNTAYSARSSERQTLSGRDAYTLHRFNSVGFRLAQSCDETERGMP